MYSTVYMYVCMYVCMYSRYLYVIINLITKPYTTVVEILYVILIFHFLFRINSIRNDPSDYHTVLNYILLYDHNLKSNCKRTIVILHVHILSLIQYAVESHKGNDYILFELIKTVVRYNNL